MDILGILSSVKGKILDAAHFDLLQTAYELQNENIEQLRTNCAALKENNELLREKTQQLEVDVGRLRAENLDLQAKVVPTKTEAYEPSELARKVILLFAKRGTDSLVDKQVEQMLGLSELEVSAAFSELSKNGIASWGSAGQSGVRYYLSGEGKQLALKYRSGELK